MPDNDIDKAGTCMSHELCSSVKNSPKRMQRHRQHADDGFRGGALSGELIHGGWSPAGKAKDAEFRAVPRAGPVVSFRDAFYFGIKMDGE